MRNETRSLRQAEIEKAAYALLETKGYAGTSMQGIARKAKASNETLYNWYGDKQGLFKALVTRNASEVLALLQAELAEDRDSIAILAELGPKLLSLLLGNRAIALNRAAAADPSGDLGMAISEAGRETVLPLVEQVLDRAKREGTLDFDDTREAASLFMDLLVGDLQIRRVIGRMPAPDTEFCSQRSAVALMRFRRLVG